MVIKCFPCPSCGNFFKSLEEKRAHACDKKILRENVKIFEREFLASYRQRMINKDTQVN